MADPTAEVRRVVGGAPTTYMAEILRFLHAAPNGVLEDDKIGVSRVVHAGMIERGFPLTVGSVSSAIRALVASGRVQATFGHRSLDNKHLYTKVVVCAEPADGITLAPSEAAVRWRNNAGSDSIEELLSSVVGRPHGQGTGHPAQIEADELEAIRTHIAHLIDENQTWELLASEAEEELVADRESFSLELARTTHDVAIQRERAEQYRKKLLAERDAVTKERKLLALAKQEIAALQQELWVLTGRLEAAHDVTDIERQRVKKLASALEKRQRESVALTRTARKREEAFAIEIYFPLVDFLINFLASLWMSGKSSIVVSDRAMASIGLVNSLGRLGTDVYLTKSSLEEFLRIVAEDSGGTTGRLARSQKGRSMGSSVMAPRLAAVRHTLDELAGPMHATELDVAPTVLPAGESASPPSRPA